MADLNVTVMLSASGGEKTVVASTARMYSPGERMKRAATLFGISILCALSLLPIPIIHLLGPPALLVTGVITASKQMRATAKLASTRIACPKCHAENRVGGGIGVRDLFAPVERQCESCRRILTMTVEAVP